MGNTKTTLGALNEYLFETLDRLTNEDLSDEELEREIRRAEAVSKTGEQVIKIADIATKVLINFGTTEGVPKMLSVNE